MLQLRLITQQQGKGLGLLNCYLDTRRGVGWAVDAHLHVTEFGRIEPHGQPLRAVRAHGPSARVRALGASCAAGDAACDGDAEAAVTRMDGVD